jgi:prolyl-tRNA synthetase
VTLLDPKVSEIFELGRQLAAAAEAAGADVLVDDREERPGVKFKDADLIGMPIRVTIGGKGLKEGVIEIKLRNQKDATKVPVAEASARISQLVRDCADAAAVR